jgi:hypothetical protein
MTNSGYTDPFRPLAMRLAAAQHALADGGHRDAANLDRATKALERAATLVRVLQPALPPESRGIRGELRAVVKAIAKNRRAAIDVADFDEFVRLHVTPETDAVDEVDEVRRTFVERRNQAGFSVVGATTLHHVRDLHTRVSGWTGPIDTDTVEARAVQAYRRARRARHRVGAQSSTAALAAFEKRLRRAAAAMTYVADATLDRTLGTRAASLDRVVDRLSEHRRLGRLWRIVHQADTDVDTRLTILDSITIRRAELLDEAFVLADVALALRPRSLLAPRI